MGVRTWGYDPDKCDGRECPPGRCDNCPIAYDGEHVPIGMAFAMLKDLKPGDTNEDGLEIEQDGNITRNL